MLCNVFVVLFCSVLINISMFICVLLIQIQTLDKMQAKGGWRLINREVFRPPEYRPMLLSVFIATGLQLFFVLLVAIIFGFSRIASTFAHHDTMLTAVIVVYILTGFIAGFCRYVVYLFCYVAISSSSLMDRPTYTFTAHITAPVCVNCFIARNGERLHSLRHSCFQGLLVRLIW